MVEYAKYELKNVCSRLSSGKSISSKMISEEGRYPVYGGNGLRGYTDHSNFSGDCAIIGRQGAFCGNVRYFSGEAYMTEHAVIVCANNLNNTHYLAYLLSTMNLGRLSGQSAQPGLSVKTLGIQEIMLPSIEYQNKVVALLSSLDEKIAVNNNINDNFKEIFHKLSEGEGTLILDNPEAPFTGGMSIEAQPRDKEKTRLNLMSGGEKSLTALAFVFAIQRYLPAPFYAFDEVDANLDGINVEKLADMVKTQAENTQFVVVSHRKPMIESANRTIGVTQKEKGITRVTGVKLRD